MVNEDVVEKISLVLSVFIIGFPLVLSLFFAMIFVPKIRKYIQNLVDLCCVNWMELQLIGSFVYFNTESTGFVEKVLRANRNWVFFNFFDVIWDEIVDGEVENCYFTEWSCLGVKNVLTVLVVLVAYWAVYLGFKVCRKGSEVLRFLEFEAGLQIVKVSTFRAFFSGCLEVKRLVQGEEGSYSSGIVLFVATWCVLAVPLYKLLYLRIKYLGNLNSHKPLTYFGSDYRAYKTCWREFHILPELSCLLISALSIVFLDSFPQPQIFLLQSTLLLFTTYTIIIRPFKSFRHNLQFCISRSLLTLIFSIQTIHHYYQSSQFQNYSITILLLLYFSLKISFVAYELHISLLGIKEIMDNSEEDLLNSTSIKELNEKNNENDFTVVTTGRLPEEPEQLLREASQSSSKVRIKRGVTGESNTESIDPRLTRKRVTRKRKTGNN